MTEKRTVRHWKTSEIQYVKDHYQTKCWQEIGDHLDRPGANVSIYARAVLKLKRDKSVRKNSWTAEEDDFLKNQYNLIEVVKIAFKLRRTVEAVRARIRHLGISTNKRKAKIIWD
jgi:hypothetical protein